MNDKYEEVVKFMSKIVPMNKNRTKVTGEQIYFLAKTCEERNYDLEKMVIASKQWAQLNDWFPSVTEFSALIRGATQIVDLSAENDPTEQLSLEAKRLDVIREEVLSRFGEEKKKEYVSNWFKQSYGMGGNLDHYGLSYSIFEKAALFDLEESNYVIEDAFKLGRDKSKTGGRYEN